MRRRTNKPAKNAWANWSYSKLSAATACPFRCFWEFIIEEPAPDNPLAAFGRAMHYMFKLFFTPHKNTGRYPYVKLESFEGAWKGFFWGAARGEYGFGGRREPPEVIAWKNNEQPRELFAKGMKIIKQFHAVNVNLRENGIPRLAEKRFMFGWHGLKISGTVDLIEIEPTGAVLTDYKLGKYPPHQSESGLQMTTYQLAYEIAIRPHLPDNPPLKALRIYDYASGAAINIPIRAPHEFGMLLVYLAEAAEYYRMVLTDRLPLGKPVLPFRFFDPADIERGDISPRLPRGEHCNYCLYLKQCRDWEFGRREPARLLFAKKKKLERLSLPTLQIPLGIEENLFVSIGSKEFTKLQQRRFNDQLVIPV